MTAISPGDRPNLDACIEYFDRMFLEYKLSKVNSSSRDVMKRAHDLALSTQAKLDSIESQHDLITRIKKVARKYNLSSGLPLHAVIRILRGKLNTDYKILSIETAAARDVRRVDGSLPLQNFIDDIADETSLSSIHMYLQSVISSLDNHVAAVMEFIETLGFRCLAGIKTRNDLIRQIDHIFNTFNDNLQQLLQLSEESELAGDQKKMDDLNRLFAGLSMARMNLDDIKNVSDHMNIKIHKLSEIAPEIARIQT